MKITRGIASVWFAVAVIAAGILMRAAGLGQLPLGEREAGAAYQVFQLSTGQAQSIAGDAFYSLFTELIFSFSGASDGAARLLSFITGSLFLLLPLLVRRQIGAMATGFLCLLLALDPALISASTTALSPMPAIFFCAVTALALVKGRTILAGVTAALFLLSGQSTWLALLIGLASVLVFTLTAQNQTARPDWADKWLSQARSLRFLGAAVACLLLLGTGFFLRPTGLSAMFADFAAFWSGWVKPGGFSPVRMLVVLLAYEILPILVGFIAYFRSALPEAARRILGVCMLVGGLLVVFYPGHLLPDLAFVSLPFVIASSLWLAEVAKKDFRFAPSELIFGLFGFVLIIFAYLNFLGLFSRIAGTLEYQFSMIGLLSAPVLLMISYILVGWGWSFRISQRGMLLALILIGVISGFSTSWHSALLGKEPEAELWNLGGRPADPVLVVSSVDQLSWQRYGVAGKLSITAIGSSSASQRWYFRAYPDYLETTGYNPAASPEILLTAGEAPELAAAYRGQDFVWLRRQDWAQMDALAWTKWASFRKMVYSDAPLFLWARTDLFSGLADDQ